jgi:putative peptidoglycan lipid II flippase
VATRRGAISDAGDRDDADRPDDRIDDRTDDRTDDRLESSLIGMAAALDETGGRTIADEPTLETASAVTALAAGTTAPPTTEVDERTAADAAGSRHVVKSAAVITLGTLMGSLLGLVRVETLNVLFYGIASGAFTIALRPIQQVSDLLVGGSVSGALMPTFVDYSAAERRRELRLIYCTVANLVALVMIVAAVGVAVAAPYFVPLETQRFSPEAQQLTVSLVQIASLSLLGLGLYLVGSALLYAMKEVVYPAFATGLYHLGIIVCGVLVLLFALHQAGVPLGAALHPGSSDAGVNLARQQGASGLAIGAALGAAGEFLLLLPGLRRIVRHWRPVLDLRHPAVRQILRLYAPLAAGLLVSVAVQNVDVALTGLTPGGAPENATSIASAVTLIQFPVGLVSAALAFSVLPLLVPAANAGDTASFKRTLILGFRLGLLLMVPAMIGLLVLGVPIVTLLFQHGACDSACTYRNALALGTMAPQLPFIALDQLLIAAYYARKNTIVPMVVGLVGAGVFLLVAAPLAPRIGLPAITWANTLQNTSHAVILFVLLTLTIGDLGMRHLFGGVLRIGVAAAGMAAVCWALLLLLPQLNGRLFASPSLGSALLTLAIAGIGGAVVYFLLAAWLRVAEVRMVGDILRARLSRRR